MAHVSAPAPEEEGEFKIILFVVLCILAGSLSQMASFTSKIPYSIYMFLFGMVYGILGTEYPEIVTYKTFTESENPKVFFFIFLPILVFESALSLPVYSFKKVLAPCILIAGPGLLIATALTAVPAFYLYASWTWTEAFLFGAVVSATDPVAVVALLRCLGAPDAVSCLIEGESLLNDGTSIVVFHIVMQMMHGTYTGGILAFLKSITWVIGGGCVVGIVCGYTTRWFTSMAVFQPRVEIAITMCAAYGTFYVAEAMAGVSGIISLVVCGVFLNANKAGSFTPESFHLVQDLWEFLVDITNTVVFGFTGVVCAGHLDSILQTANFTNLIYNYISVNVIRTIVVFLFYPFLSPHMDWRGAAVVAFSGLRGAVGLILAILVSFAPNLGKQFKQEFISQIAGIVLLTSLVNGWCCSYLLSALGLDRIADSKAIRVHSAAGILTENMEENLENLKQDAVPGGSEEFLQGASWKFITKLACTNVTRDLGVTEDIAWTRDSAAEVARLNFLELLTASFNSQYEKGLIQVWGYNNLLQMVARAIESPDEDVNCDTQHIWNISWIERSICQMPLLGMFMRAHITERWASIYDLMLGYSHAVDEAIKACQASSLTYGVEGINLGASVALGDFAGASTAAGGLAAQPVDASPKRFPECGRESEEIIPPRDRHTKSGHQIVTFGEVSCVFDEAEDDLSSGHGGEMLGATLGGRQRAGSAMSLGASQYNMLNRSAACGILDWKKERDFAPQIRDPQMRANILKALDRVIFRYKQLRSQVVIELNLLRQNHPVMAKAVINHRATRMLLNQGRQVVNRLGTEGVIDKNQQVAFDQVLQNALKRTTTSAFLPMSSPIMFEEELDVFMHTSRLQAFDASSDISEEEKRSLL